MEKDNWQLGLAGRQRITERQGEMMESLHGKKIRIVLTAVQKLHLYVSIYI